ARRRRGRAPDCGAAPAPPPGAPPAPRCARACARRTASPSRSWRARTPRRRRPATRTGSPGGGASTGRRARARRRRPRWRGGARSRRLCRSRARRGRPPPPTRPRGPAPRVWRPRRVPWPGSSLHLQHRQERLLRDLHRSDRLHPLLAFLLLLEKLALARDVAAVALGEHVLAHRLLRLARDHPAADGRLDGHLVHLLGDLLFQLFADDAASLVGALAVHDGGERIYGLSIDEDVEPHEIGFLVPDRFVVERGIAARDALQLVEEVE